MKELSLHILDIAENSINADADNIYIKIEENTNDNKFKVLIEDDGNGIDADILENITDPFITSRKTRPVGLGLSLFKAAAERCNGKFKIESDKSGTKVKAVFAHDHIDRAPLGNIAQTLISILFWNNNVDLTYKHIYNNMNFEFDTEEIKKEIGDTKITESQIINWLKNYIKDNLQEIRGGELN